VPGGMPYALCPSRCRMSIEAYVAQSTSASRTGRKCCWSGSSSFSREHGRRIRRICGGKLSEWEEEKLEFFIPLREGHFVL
jgi:hypothetical protein